MVTLILGEKGDSSVIFLAILINAIFGFWEEDKTLNVLDKLKSVLQTKAVVLREGRKIEVSQEDLVPGEIIFLKAGDKVPADGRVVWAEN